MYSNEQTIYKNTKNLHQSMRITTDARFQASKRLNSMDNYAFVTTTVLSLGLILIPLLQLSGLKLYYPEKVLSAIQIFFAVAVLVYSVIISTAKYSVRAIEFSQCADSIKDLARNVKNALAQHSEKPLTESQFNEFNDSYRQCLINSENHSDHDYYVVRHTLRIKDKDKSEGLHWFDRTIKHNFYRFILKVSCGKKYIFPTLMMMFELVVIFDILGFTTIIHPFIIKF